jgi:CobQ-like glutamine amidotransferase family enzyme
VRLDLWHLYPQDMNIYGDRGNVIALLQRARWRGIEVELHTCDVGDRIDPDRCDLVFAGGGQDDQQVAVAADLAGPNGEALRALAEDDAPMLLVCGTYQLFGHYFRTGAGGEIRGIGLLDLHTVAGSRRMIGDQVVTCPLEGGATRTLVGFENHSGQTYLGAGCRPLGRVASGGNNGHDGQEGALHRQVHGTYLHGPVLPKNPWLADRLIEAARRRRGVTEPLAPLDDAAEDAAHRRIVERIARQGRRASGVV